MVQLQHSSPYFKSYKTLGLIMKQLMSSSTLVGFLLSCCFDGVWAPSSVVDVLRPTLATATAFVVGIMVLTWEYCTKQQMSLDKYTEFKWIWSRLLNLSILSPVKWCHLLKGFLDSEDEIFKKKIFAATGSRHSTKLLMQLKVVLYGPVIVLVEQLNNYTDLIFTDFFFL